MMLLLSVRLIKMTIKIKCMETLSAGYTDQGQKSTRALVNIFHITIYFPFVLYKYVCFRNIA